MTFSDDEEERIGILSQNRNPASGNLVRFRFSSPLQHSVSETKTKSASATKNNERQEVEGHSSAKEVEEEELPDDEGAVGCNRLGNRSMGDGEDAGKLQGTREHRRQTVAQIKQIKVLSDDRQSYN